MSAPTEETDDGEQPAEEAAGGRKSKKILFVIIGGVVLLAAAGSGVLMSGLLGGSSGSLEQHAEAPASIPSEPVFYALPEIVVSLNGTERRSTFLKVKVSLELADRADEPRIERVLPRVVDDCQVYLRELRLDDIRGSAGTARLREELLRRINAAVSPVPVKDVLFSDLLTQ